MRKNFNGRAAIMILVLLISSCQLPERRDTARSMLSPRYDPALAHTLVKKLTDMIVVDIFTPPVASRIYANTSLAMYEAIRFLDTSQPSIASKLNGFDPMPLPEKGVVHDFSISAVQAFCETAKKVTFSADEIQRFKDSLIGRLSAGMDKEVLNNSLVFGTRVADVIVRRLSADNYQETRGMERFEVNTKDPARWVPTAPDYADALEPHWFKMKPFVLKRPDEYRADPFPAYDRRKGSRFYNEMNEVYAISKQLTEEQIDITLFWDDNPFISKHKGHVMFQDKKMTPGGHWMAITQTACRLRNADLVGSAKAYVGTSIALYDAFISCWFEKYYSARIRPQTAIQRLIDDQWFSYLQTPPFPEYTSGHSTISASAAEALTHIFGDNIPFTDSSELEYGLPVRSFSSFRQAAQEASISRVYGGIHFRSGCDNGNKLGIRVGEAVIQRVFK